MWQNTLPISSCKPSQTLATGTPWPCLAMTSTSCNALCHASAARCLVAPRLLVNERHSNRNANLSMSTLSTSIFHIISSSKQRFCAAKLICISRHGVFGALWPCNHTRVEKEPLGWAAPNSPNWWSPTASNVVPMARSLLQAATTCFI